MKHSLKYKLLLVLSLLLPVLAKSSQSEWWWL
ncbi:hypothetical protein QMA0248_0071 [Streptococcus iniae]|nr:hypothetical protein QMA0248_0071 [Streptococcus iniae]ATX38833.1 hypothetical protein CTW00_00616 [Streptococcus iniae]